MYGQRYMDVYLNGLSLRALFRSAVNFMDPAQVKDCFFAEEIAAHPSFKAWRDKLNDNGMDIRTLRGHYLLLVDNVRPSIGQKTPFVRLSIVPWDGVKKPLEPFDSFKHTPRSPSRLFY